MDDDKSMKPLINDELAFQIKCAVGGTVATAAVGYATHGSPYLLLPFVFGTAATVFGADFYRWTQEHAIVPRAIRTVKHGVASLPRPASKDPQPYMLRLGQSLTTRKRLDVHIDSLYGNGTVIAGIQGAGKSVVFARLMEQSGKTGGPMIVFDHKGEYSTLAEMPYMKVLQAGITPLNLDAEGEQFHLTPETVEAFVEKVLTEEYQAVINLPSYGDNWIDRAMIVAEVTRVIMAWAASMKHTDRLPCLVFLDEAQLYLPENLAMLPSEARTESGKAIVSDLSNAYFRLVSNGRSNGFTVAFATQSLTYIAKAFIKSCPIKVIMKHAEHNDLDACERMVDKHIAVRADFENFRPGEAVVFGLSGTQQRVQFDQRESSHQSSTPNYARLLEVRERRKSTMLAPVAPSSQLVFSQTQQASKTTGVVFTPEQILKLKSTLDEATFTAVMASFTDQPAPIAPVRQDASEEDEEEEEASDLLTRGIEAYINGDKTLERLAATLGITVWEARKLKPSIEKHTHQ